MSDRWRGVVAALLNPDLRAVLAETIGASELSDARRARAKARLREIGLLSETAGGDVFDEDFVRSILAENAPTRPTGVVRFLDRDGRIIRWPVRFDDLLELLQWVAARALEPSAAYTEAEINERLAAFTDDVALLRRHLVDAGVVARTPSGSEYRLAGSGP
ncbi:MULTISPECIES: DUF2087 domain-containing protein [Microbacterium]|uniref:DUF2087 domain-containing protein n=1 Tax=Microbacterium TaxID=33882 RepID=UPI00146BD1C3|nr:MULTISPECIES: DUF2087 domain-containing protein [Microbacterium]